MVSFQTAQKVYDGTVEFCKRFVSKFSRTNDQMVEAARSGVQNIAEGSLALFNINIANSPLLFIIEPVETFGVNDVYWNN